MPVPLTSKNARKALELARRIETPVYAGASSPLIRKLVTAEHVHGRTGFDGYELPEPTMPLTSGFAPEAIVDLVMSRKANEVTLCCLAPLTNIALALAKEPRSGLFTRDRIDGRRIFGRRKYHARGGVQHFRDPEAAARVLGVRSADHHDPARLHTSGAHNQETNGEIKAVGTQVSEAFYHLLKFNKVFDEAEVWMGGRTAARCYGYRLFARSRIFSGRRVNVEVECASPLSLGMTVVDWWAVTQSRRMSSCSRGECRRLFRSGN